MSEAKPMDMARLAEIFEAVKVIPLRPSDFLVFRTAQALNLEQMAEVHSYIEGEVGHSRILILTGGADLEVLRAERPPEEPAPVDDAVARHMKRRLSGG